MAKKLVFYEQYGVEEYYIYDPERIDFTGYLRGNNKLEVIEGITDWVSPRLGIHFVLTPEQLQIYDPQGNHFVSMQELSQKLSLAERENERLRALLRQAGVEDSPTGG